MVKRGDTLIEVTLAVGIFSMIAIAIVSVTSAGTSNVQTALETTLAREEIDAQAEALRFIQSAYVNNRESDNKFSSLWKKITESAIVLNGSSTDNNIVQYSPDSCASIYNSGALSSQNAFIINVNKLGTFSASSVSDVFVKAKDSPNKFAEASTYPRITYGSSSDSETLIADNSNQDIYQAEGIYIVPVRDASKTVIFADSGRVTKAAYYDFYIRTCWYGANSNEPSTIATVIRLYDPSITEE